MECVDNNHTDVEENFEESVTYVDSRKLKVDDSVTKENESVMNFVQFDDECSVGSGYSTNIKSAKYRSYSRRDWFKQ